MFDFTQFLSEWGLPGAILLGIGLFVYYKLWPFFSGPVWNIRVERVKADIALRKATTELQQATADRVANVHHSVATMTDILKEHTGESAQVFKLLQRLTAAVEVMLTDMPTIRVGCLMFDPTGSVIDCDDEAMQILRLPNKDAARQISIHDPNMFVIRPDGRKIDPDNFPVARALKTGQVQRAEIHGYRGAHAPDDTIWLMLVARPISHEGEVKGAATSIIDIGHQMQVLNNELARVNGLSL